MSGTTTLAAVHVMVFVLPLVHTPRTTRSSTPTTAHGAHDEKRETMSADGQNRVELGRTDGGHWLKSHERSGLIPADTQSTCLLWSPVRAWQGRSVME